MEGLDRATTAIPAVGYHPLLAGSLAGTGDVLMSRLREGRANTARGAAHSDDEPHRCGAGLSPAETVSRVAVPGPAGNLRRGPTAASTPTLSSPPVVEMDVASPSPSASTKAAVIEADW